MHPNDFCEPMRNRTRSYLVLQAHFYCDTLLGCQLPGRFVRALVTCAAKTLTTQGFELEGKWISTVDYWDRVGRFNPEASADLSIFPKSYHCLRDFSVSWASLPKTSILVIRLQKRVFIPRSAGGPCACFPRFFHLIIDTHLLLMSNEHYFTVFDTSTWV